MKGIDISDYQGLPDFSLIVKAGYEFVIIKATEGIHTINQYAARQAAAAKAAGLQIGWYHFGHPEATNHTVQDEAKHFLANLPPTPADIILTLDVEQAKTPVPAGTLQQWIKDFQTTLNQPLMLYSNKPFLDSNLPAAHGLGNMPLWVAAYFDGTPNHTPKLPIGWSNYTIWQYSGSGVIPGLPSQFDLDICSVLPLANLPA